MNKFVKFTKRLMCDMGISDIGVITFWVFILTVIFVLLCVAFVLFSSLRC